MGTDGVLVGPAAFKAVMGRAERPRCVRFAHVSAMYDKRATVFNRRWRVSTSLERSVEPVRHSDNQEAISSTWAMKPSLAVMLPGAFTWSKASTRLSEKPAIAMLLAISSECRA